MSRSAAGDQNHGQVPNYEAGIPVICPTQHPNPVGGQAKTADGETEHLGGGDSDSGGGGVDQLDDEGTGFAGSEFEADERSEEIQ